MLCTVAESHFELHVAVFVDDAGKKMYRHSHQKKQ